MATWRLIQRLPQRFPTYIRYSIGYSCNARLNVDGVSARHISTSAALCWPGKPASRLQGSLSFLFGRRGGDGAADAGSALVPVAQAEEKLRVQRKVWEEVVGLDNKPATEKFIPIARHMLVKALVKDMAMLSPGEKDRLEDFAAALDAYTSQRFYIQLDEMKHLYDLLDPDKDTLQVRQVTKKELLEDQYELLQKLEAILYKANFFKIPRDRTLFLIKEHEAGEGVRVVINPLDYSVLQLWTRGRMPKRQSFFKKLKHKTKNLLSQTDDDSSHLNDIYTRVFVAMRLRKENKLHLKMFKDIPCNHLEHLLPNGKILMSKFDKGFLAASAFLGTLAITVKLYSLALDWKIDFGLLGLTIAALIGAKGWSGYKNKRNNYLLSISRTLYYNTVSNNRGVLTLLTDRALDEEFKETLLAYVFLLSPPNRRGVPGTTHTTGKPEYDTAKSLQSRIQQWLLDTFKVDNMQFDIEDALYKLDNMGLLVRHADDTFSVLPIDAALDILPAPGAQWESLGALRDSESSEHEKDSYSTSQQGWK